jgi:hypothetical protein
MIRQVISGAIVASLLVGGTSVVFAQVGTDTTVPTVAMALPVNGATVSGTTEVRATATDNVGVAGVQFYLDGVKLGLEDNTAPEYNIDWNTLSVGNGAHTLLAVARDAAGNSATSSSITVTVANVVGSDTIVPTVSVAAPVNGTTVSGTIHVTASASDNVGVVGVQFYLGNTKLGSEVLVSPFNISWNTQSVVNGVHTLFAVARDAAGNIATSTGVSVTVANAVGTDTTAPLVEITSPVNGSTVSGQLPITASSSDNVGVVGVQFRLDGSNIGVEDIVAPFGITLDTTSIANGGHTLTALARDAAGNTTLSSVVTVTVANVVGTDTTLPAVEITAPANGSTVSGNVTVTASSSDNVGVAGVQFRLDGVNLGAEDVVAPFSIAWNTVTSANGAHTLTALARDASGNTRLSAPVTVTVANTPGVPAQGNVNFKLEVNTNGKIEMRGIVESVGVDTLMVRSWGGLWTVHVSTVTGLTSNTATVSNGLSSLFLVGDAVDVKGVVSSTETMHVDATKVKGRHTKTEIKLRSHELENRFRVRVQDQFSNLGAGSQQVVVAGQSSSSVTSSNGNIRQEDRREDRRDDRGNGNGNSGKGRGNSGSGRDR